jgi:hypothetical protein
MGVYLGNNGRILIRRNSNKTAFFTKLQGSDVNVDRRRFSVDGAHEQFITGDRIEITTLPENEEVPLTLIPGNVDPTGQIQSSYAGFAHVDPIGGIRLYDNLADSINGFSDQAIELGDIPDPGLDISIEVVARSDENCLGLVKSFSITTSRENIDTTCLSEHYKHSYENGLVQGQGQITCFWDYPQDCEKLQLDEKEFASYLAKLCVRLVQGSSFHGFFFMYYGVDTNEKSVWYECENCIVNNVAISVSPGQLIEAEISFITSGKIDLRESYIPQYLLQEQDAGLILNEDGRRIRLENSES